MKKIICSVSAVLLIVLTLSSCDLGSSGKLTEQQQKTIDVIWQNKQNWEEITGYFSGNGKCDSVSFSEANGRLVFTCYRMGSGNTVSSNSYYIYADKMIKMDNFDSQQNTLGLYRGVQWSESSTKDDLIRVYKNYLKSKK